MRSPVVLALMLSFFSFTASGEPGSTEPEPGFEYRIRRYVDSLHVIDTHEHLFTPEILLGSCFLDFTLLFQTNSYEDLLSAGMSESHYDSLFNEILPPLTKWKIIEPYWERSFNTSFSRVIMTGISDLYGLNELNESTVPVLSERIEKNHMTDWFDRILRDSCKIDYVIQDGYYMPGKDEYFRYAKRFEEWLTVRSKFRIDSIAINQLDPIFTIEDFVKSLRTAFEKEVKKGMQVVKVFSAYSRNLEYEKYGMDAAKKVFRSLVNSDEAHKISHKEAKPLQDFMMYELLGLAEEYNIPVAFHTGLQSGLKNTNANSNPALLTTLIRAFPRVRFTLYHGGYPFGGELSALAKNFSNVYIDMNWMWAVSPTYSERYFSEWLETVPAARLIAFGGDAMVVENVYSELKSARRIISDVLCRKVKDGYFSESEAKMVARMLLRDNAARLYNLK